MSEDVLDKLAYAFRPPDPTDLAFILSNWLHDVRHSPIVRYCPNHVVKARYHALAEAALKRSKVLIACNPDCHVQIYGFLVFETLSNGSLYLHWCHVKSTFRGFGLATEMLRHVVPTLLTPQAPVLVCSHTGADLFKRQKNDDGSTQDNPTVQKFQLEFDPFDFLSGLP